MIYIKTKTSVLCDRLQKEINTSSISKSCIGVTHKGENDWEIDFGNDQLTGSEETVLDSLVAAHSSIIKKMSSENVSLYGTEGLHKEIIKLSGKITNENYYKNLNPTTESLSGIAVAITYNYTGSKIVGKTTILYYEDGTIASTKTISYKSDNTNSNRTIEVYS